MITPKLLLFDMDDTLLDSRSAATATYAWMANEYGPRLGIAPEQLRAAVQREGAAFWKDEAAVGHWRVDLRGARQVVIENAAKAEGFDPALAGEMASGYDEAYFQHLAPFADTIEALERLRAHGYALGMVTNGPGWFQRKKIAQHALEPYFRTIVIEGEFGAGKPDPSVFRHALATAGARAEESWHVGDNQYADIGGAQSVGVHAVWIHRERLELQGDHPTPDRAIAHLDELIEAVIGR